MDLPGAGFRVQGQGQQEKNVFSPLPSSHREADLSGLCSPQGFPSPVSLSAHEEASWGGQHRRGVMSRFSGLGSLGIDLDGPVCEKASCPAPADPGARGKLCSLTS